MAGSHAGVRRQLAEEKTAAAVKRGQISSVPRAARRLIVLGRRAPHEIRAIPPGLTPFGRFLKRAGLIWRCKVVPSCDFTHFCIGSGRGIFARFLISYGWGQGLSWGRWSLLWGQWSLRLRWSRLFWRWFPITCAKCADANKGLFTASNPLPSSEIPIEWPAPNEYAKYFAIAGVPSKLRDPAPTLQCLRNGR